MGIALVQSARNNVGTGTVVTVTLPGPSTAGNTYLAYGSCIGTATASMTISDTVNGTYQVDVTNGSLGSHSASIARFSVIGNGSPTFTLNSNVAGSGLGLTIQEWSGLDIPPVLDQSAKGINNAGTTTPTTGATNTLSQSGQLVVCHAVVGTNTVWTAGAGFSLDPNLNFTNAQRGTEYLIAGTNAAQTGSFTIAASQAWVAIIATYLPFSQLSNDTLSGQFLI